MSVCYNNTLRVPRMRQELSPPLLACSAASAMAQGQALLRRSLSLVQSQARSTHHDPAVDPAEPSRMEGGSVTKQGSPGPWSQTASGCGWWLRGFLSVLCRGFLTCRPGGRSATPSLRPSSHGTTHAAVPSVSSRLPTLCQPAPDYLRALTRGAAQRGPHSVLARRAHPSAGCADQTRVPK